MASHPAARRVPEKASKIKEAQVFALVLGSVIERLRRQRAWTQAQLAENVGATQPVISRIESGRMQPDAFLYGKLAAAFGMSVQDLEARVNEAIRATKRAAEAVADSAKSPDEVLAAVGAFALVGLIAFAVAALVDGVGAKVPKPKA
jgi:transcriptional regulator with XRE-family HTH domain